MSVEIINFNNTTWYSEDFYKVCDFLIRINQNKIITPHFLWARWVWQFSPYLNMENLSRIGIAENGDKIIGLTTYEHDIGEAFLCADEQYKFIIPQLIDFSIKHLSINNQIDIIIPDGDLAYQQAAVKKD